jgi:hypothetical protein
MSDSNSEYKKVWPPLGLPTGSVRALLTLLIVAVVVVQSVRGQEIELLWAETLMIALAHYFTTRRFLNLPPDVIRRLAKEGHVEPEANPLFLPRFSIRLILLATFAGLAVYLYQKNQLLDSPALPILGVVAAYVLGIMAGFRRVRWFEDLKAAVVLLVLLATALPYFLNRPDLVPNQMRYVALGLVLFYFGSR